MASHCPRPTMMEWELRLHAEPTPRKSQLELMREALADIAYDSPSLEVAQKRAREALRS